MTTRENPWPLALLTKNIKAYVDRMSALWVEGQVVEYRPRAGTKMAFFTVRDGEREASMTVKAFRSVLDRTGAGFEEGAKVVFHCKPDFYERNGQISLMADEIHLQGIGNLLAQIEATRRRLEQEGLFRPDRKRPLPFLPRVIGIVSGNNAKGAEDVMVNAGRRWPGVRFETRVAAVQGPNTVREVTAAMLDLDSRAEVDVIVVTRGGGAVEDLLPFSDEAMVRTAAGLRTPLVSAVGHESDVPLLDLVADYRASTPTDAANRIVPDWNQEMQGLIQATDRMRQATAGFIDRERESLAMLTTRPVLASPAAALSQHEQAVDTLEMRLRTGVSQVLGRERTALHEAEGTLRAVSPQATLDRGYALLRTPGGDLVRDAADISKGDLLEGILARGTLVTQVVGANPGGHGLS